MHITMYMRVVVCLMLTGILSAAVGNGKWIQLPDRSSWDNHEEVLTTQEDPEDHRYIWATANGYIIGDEAHMYVMAICLGQYEYDDLSALATAKNVWWEKRWKYSDCPNPPPNDQFQESILVEKTWKVEGNTNNDQYSPDGWARTIAQSHININSYPDNAGDYQSNGQWSHEGVEGDLIPDQAILVLTWPPQLRLTWDFRDDETWYDLCGDDPDTGVVEPGEIHLYEQNISNNGNPLVGVKITLYGHATAAIKYKAFIASAECGITVKKFVLKPL